MKIENGSLSDPQTIEAPNPVILHTGMEITPSPVRTKLQEYTDHAYYEWYTGWRKGAVDRSNAIFDKIANGSAISIVERRSVENDYHYRCAEYVFNTRQGEPWSLKYDDQDRNGFWIDTLDFLLAHGYTLGDVAGIGDIIVYGFPDSAPPDNRMTEYRHFGIYEGNGQVISKFDMGHVFRHPWDLVPASYGTHIAFFRKSQSNVQEEPLLSIDYCIIVCKIYLEDKNYIHAPTKSQRPQPHFTCSPADYRKYRRRRTLPKSGNPRAGIR